MDQITNYSTLKTAVAGMVHRPGSTTVTDNVGLFIQLCEARLNDMLMLKNMESEEPLTLTLSQNYVALPTGYISPIEFWLVINSVRSVLSPAVPEELPYSPTDGIPAYWAIDGANIRFDCPAADAYSAKFRMVKASNLSDSNTSNYLLLRRQDIYLAGTIVEFARWSKDADLFPVWESKFLKATSEMKAAEARARSIVPMRTEPATRGSRYNIYFE